MGDWSFLASLLDKVQSHSTVVGKVWMSVLFLFRLFALAAGLDKIWGDEQGSLDCNIKSVGCKNAAYDRTFPMSHTRFWVLQILFVSLPTLIYLGHVLLVIRRENKLRRKLEQKVWRDGAALKSPIYSDERGRVEIRGALLVSYTLQLIAKILLEVAFAVGQYYLYGFIFMPDHITYEGYPCKQPVQCFIPRPTEKSVFIVFMLAVSGFSVLLNVIELFYLAGSKILQARKRRRSYGGGDTYDAPVSEMKMLRKSTFC